MIRRAILLPLLVVGAASATWGCSSPEEDSCNIKTPGIYVEYEVAESGSAADVRATFWVGNEPGGTSLELGTCGDTIDVNGHVLSEHQAVPADYYGADIELADEYIFTFSRVDEDPYETVVYPPPYITSPTSGESVSRADDLEITWDNARGGDVNLLIDGSCIWNYPDTLGDLITDDGSYTVPANGLEATASGEDESCELDIELTREQGGLNSSLKGTIEAKGELSFISTP